jgi:hypothetical protein
VHALWLGRGLYAELRVADVVQEVRSAYLSHYVKAPCSMYSWRFGTLQCQQGK